MITQLKKALSIIGNVVQSRKTYSILQKFGINETQLVRLHEDQNSQFGIITTYRGEYGHNENKRRNNELIEYLNSVGYSWEQTQGAYKELTSESTYKLENSFVVKDIPFGVVKDLMLYYNQDSFIYKDIDGLVGLYNLSTSTAIPWTIPDVEKGETPYYNMQAPRPKKLQDQGIDQQDVTRWRDVETQYTFDEKNAVPFSNSSAF